MTEHKCVRKVHGAYRDVSGPIYPCQRPATVLRDGKWYCWQHDPERVEADKKKRQAKREAEDRIRTARWARSAAMHRICRGVSTEDLEKLEDGAVRRLLDGHDGMPTMKGDA